MGNLPIRVSRWRKWEGIRPCPIFLKTSLPFFVDNLVPNHLLLCFIFLVIVYDQCCASVSSKTKCLFPFLILKCIIFKGEPGIHSIYYIQQIVNISLSKTKLLRLWRDLLDLSMAFFLIFFIFLKNIEVLRNSFDFNPCSPKSSCTSWLKISSQ